jgi:hypothetical protein
MNCNILSQNVRGLNSPNKRLMVRNLLRQLWVDIVCLQETKLELISMRIINSLWGCSYVDWCYVAFTRGILLMWDRKAVIRLEMEMGDCVAACTFKNVMDGFEWAFAGVYGPNGDFDRHLLWDELAGLLSWWNMLWYIEGYFLGLVWQATTHSPTPPPPPTTLFLNQSTLRPLPFIMCAPDLSFVLKDLKTLMYETQKTRKPSCVRKREEVFCCGYKG